MAKKVKPTRAQAREARALIPEAGLYGVDVKDAGAAAWIGRYLTFATSADEAKRRIRDAGFHRKDIEARWSPARMPPGELPDVGSKDDNAWFRSRDGGAEWSSWERLPPNYRHPPQGLAAVDPSVH